MGSGTITRDRVVTIGRNKGTPVGQKEVGLSTWMDFTTGGVYTLDLGTTDQTGIFGVPRSIFINNLNNPSNLSISATGTQFQFDAPANSAGYYKLDSINNSAQLAFATDGGATTAVRIIVYNYDIGPNVWYKFGVFDGTKPLQVYGTLNDGGNIATDTHPAPIKVAGIDRATGIIHILSVDANGAQNVNTTLAGSLPTGANVIGRVGIDQTTPGTTNLVANSALYLTAPPAPANNSRAELLLDGSANLRVRLTATATSGTDFIANTSIASILAANASDTLTTVRPLAVAGSVFNGGTWDRQVGNVNGGASLPALTTAMWRYAPPVGGIVNTTVAVTIKTAAGAGVANYLSSISIGHDVLGAVTEFAIRDGAGGTVLWRGRLQVTAKEDTTISFPVPLKGTANTLMEIVTLTAVTGGVYCNAQGFTGV